MSAAPSESSSAASSTPAPSDLGGTESRSRLPARIVVLASGTGSLLEAILERSRRDDADFSVVAIGVDRECRAARIVRDAGIPLIDCRLADHPDRSAWDEALTAAVDAADPAWVVTAGFMKILGPAFLARFGGRVVNSHPALLPAFPGAHGVRDALAYGVRVTGTTVHLVDDGVDTGPILAQQPVIVDAADTEESLHERIKSAERVLLADVVTRLVAAGVVIDGRKAYIP